MLVTGRRITGAPDGPLLFGALLGLAAIVEVAVGADLAPVDTYTALLLALGSTVPVAAIRRHHLVAAASVTAAMLLSLWSGHRPTAAGLLAQLFVLYVVARRRLHTARGAAVERDESRRAAVDALLDNAARGERARIARELHDVVAHHISMIAVQAETARLTTPGMPAAGADRLASIGDTARQALTEMRRLLSVLREDAGTEPTRQPQPGLAQLIDLVDEARDAAGTSTRLIVRGRVLPLEPGVELTAYRIVQEALTNARRHASSVAADVELEYAGDAVRLRVRDNGPGPLDDAPDTLGHGLLGMHERATMAGGTLRTGGSPTGGFLVEAVLPAAKAAG
jgi:signal transduction histidine kinase